MKTSLLDHYTLLDESGTLLGKLASEPTKTGPEILNSLMTHNYQRTAW